MADLSCAAVALAAGSSSRLGRPKQLVEIDGEPLLRRTVRLAVEAGCDPVLVVLGFEADGMRASLDGLPVLTVVNPGWAEGMGSSLRCGVEQVAALDPCPGNVLLLVCDQFALSAEVLRELLRVHALGSEPITASRYGGRLAVPAVFAASFFPELLAISGDRGAREILERNVVRAAWVEFPDGVKDLDVAEQLDS